MRDKSDNILVRYYDSTSRGGLITQRKLRFVCITDVLNHAINQLKLPDGLVPGD